MFGRNTTAILMAGMIGAVAMMAPAFANAKMREIYRFSGIVVGVPAGELVDDDDPFVVIDVEDAERITILHCANLGRKSARVRAIYFDETGKPFTFDKTVQGNTGFTVATADAGLSGLGDFFDIEQIKAGLGVVLSNRSEIACSAQVLNQFSQYVYDLPLERVAQNDK